MLNPFDDAVTGQRVEIADGWHDEDNVDVSIH
jgi:hypothetical protein